MKLLTIFTCAFLLTARMQADEVRQESAPATASASEANAPNVVAPEPPQPPGRSPEPLARPDCDARCRRNAKLRRALAYVVLHVARGSRF